MSILGLLFWLVVVTASVSCMAGALLRSRVLAVVGSFVIIELSILIYLYRYIASSTETNEIIGMPPVVAIVVAPLVLLVSFFTVKFVTRISTKNHGQTNDL